MREAEAVCVESLMLENKRLKGQLEELEQLRQLVYCDPLTKLRNRRYFQERLNQELSLAQRHSEAPFSLALLDIDSFKHINDTHGHSAGDRALVWFASSLCSQLRQQDVCCRLGGDEFAVILPHTEATTRHFVERRLRMDAGSEASLGFPVTFSLGCATYGVEGESYEEIYNAADIAMYKDKQKRAQSVA